MTNGGFRPDGTFMPVPVHDVTTLAEALAGSVLRMSLRRDLLEEAAALRMR